MCRIYKARAGWYVRLCYYHGDRKGEKIPVPQDFVLDRQHYPRQRSLNLSSRKTGKGEIAQCISCGCCLSRHNTSGICTFCTEHPERRPVVGTRLKGEDQ